MTINNHKKLMQALVLVACLKLSGCVPDNGVTPRVLEGEWKLVEINGLSVASNEAWTWEFQEDGDFTFCYDGDCYSGEWSWNSSRDELDIEYTDDWGDKYFTEFEVEVLDRETLKGDWNWDGDLYALEFERDE